MNDFNDFRKTVSQSEIDRMMQSISSTQLKLTKDTYPELSDTECLLSVATGAAVNMAFFLLEKYHNWIFQS